MPKVRRVLKAVVLEVLLVSLWATVFVAVPSAQERGYVQGSIGVARTIDNDSAYAGLGAWRLNDRLHLFGEIGRLRDAINDDLNDRVDAIEETIRANNETAFHSEFPIVFEARVPAWYGLGGIRADGPSAGRLSTYLEGGLGSARLDPQVHLTINGDRLDDEAEAISGIRRGDQQLEFIAGAGAGVAVKLWKRIRIEGGYRYMRIFGDAKTNINRVHVGAGWTF